MKLRDKASNLDLHGQSVASCLLDDPGSQGTRSRPPSTSPGEVDAAARSHPCVGQELWHVRPKPNDVVQATRQPFDPGSPKYGVLRGGALEPGARAFPDNVQAKADAYSAANSAAPKAQKDLSLSGGASSSVLAFQLSITFRNRTSGLGHKKGDPVGSPSLVAVMRLNRVSAQTPQRGPGDRTALPLRGCARTRPARHRPVSQGSSWSCRTSCRTAP